MDRYAQRLQEECDRAQPRTLASPVLRDVCLLESIFAQLPLESILALSLVNRTLHSAAKRELYADVRLDGTVACERFAALLYSSDVGRQVRGFHVTK